MNCAGPAARAPQFEHRLFLSPRPQRPYAFLHRLAEMLDPVRFTRASEMSPAMRGRVEDVVVRRLKRDINADSEPRFCTRNPPRALTLPADAAETELANAFDAFRAAIRDLVGSGTKGRRRAGTFAVEVLRQAPLSVPQPSPSLASGPPWVVISGNDRELTARSALKAETATTANAANARRTAQPWSALDQELRDDVAER